MKPTINKSRLMKRAWNIFRGHNPYSYSFSAALRRAWEVEKENVRHEAEKAEKAAKRALMNDLRSPVEVSESWNAGAAAYYATARPGTYFGD